MASITDLATASSISGTVYSVINQDGTDKKITPATLIGGALTGGGTLATGGFTLTVPATGAAALLAASQTFTAKQAVAPTATDANGLEVYMPASTTGKASITKYNNANRIIETATATETSILLDAFDNGSGGGPYINIARNSNGSTPAAGALVLRNRAGTDYFLWVDASGKLRIHTAQPTNALDGAGDVVGAQTA